MDNLKDIYNDIQLSNHFLLNDNEIDLFIENTLFLIDIYINDIQHHYNKLYIYQDIKNIIYHQFDNDMYFNLCDDNESDIDILIFYCIDVYYITFLNNGDNNSYNNIDSDSDNNSDSESNNDSNNNSNSDSDSNNNNSYSNSKSNNNNSYSNSESNNNNSYSNSESNNNCDCDNNIKIKINNNIQNIIKKRNIKINNNIQNKDKIKDIKLNISLNINNNNTHTINKIENNKNIMKDTENDIIIENNKNIIEDIIKNTIDDIIEDIENDITIEDIDKQLNILRNIKQPEQRTTDWYIFRNNCITASNAYKCFESEKVRNQLIYEKCIPYKEYNYNININSPLHWGQKYEPISVMVYEKIYNTKIEEFGCISHSTYDFLAASPDGINIDKKSYLYGRMLEIKNPISRIITGIPKKEYYIQMQLQMECCNLNKCDFLETKFYEYDTEEEYLIDGDFLYSKDNKQKGIIILFYKDKKPIYEYKPITMDKEDYDIWVDNIIDKNIDKTFTKYIYWKLEHISCILIKRDKKWFNNHIDKMIETWNIIKEEKKNGDYNKRAPVKRKKLEH